MGLVECRACAAQCGRRDCWPCIGTGDSGKDSKDSTSAPNSPVANPPTFMASNRSFSATSRETTSWRGGRVADFVGTRIAMRRARSARPGASGAGDVSMAEAIASHWVGARARCSSMETGGVPEKGAPGPLDGGEAAVSGSVGSGDLAASVVVCANGGISLVVVDEAPAAELGSAGCCAAGAGPGTDPGGTVPDKAGPGWGVVSTGTSR